MRCIIKDLRHLGAVCQPDGWDPPPNEADFPRYWALLAEGRAIGVLSDLPLLRYEARLGREVFR